MNDSTLEAIENLEQLRVLEAGHTILVGVVDEPTIGIDTEADYWAFVSRQRNCYDRSPGHNVLPLQNGVPTAAKTLNR